MVVLKEPFFRMAEQLRGPFEKFVDSPTRSNKVRTHLITTSWNFVEVR
jgi:hypothetical protein